jgi:hypothetical protein
MDPVGHFVQVDTVAIELQDYVGAMLTSDEIALPTDVAADTNLARVVVDNGSVLYGIVWIEIDWLVAPEPGGMEVLALASLLALGRGSLRHSGRV